MSDSIGRSDLIKRNDVLGIIEEWYCSTHKITKLNELAEMLKGDSVYKAIYKLSAVDAVAVVRCKDCRYRGDEYECPLLAYAEYTCDDEYCSDGARREEDATD